MTNTDRRFMKTEAVIKQAFFELLRETGIKKLTVSALCKRADITRKTFYLHYENIDMLFRSTINELVLKALVSNVIKGYEDYQTYGNTDAFRSAFKENEYQALKIIHDNIEEVNILLMKKNHDAFMDTLKKDFLKQVPENLFSKQNKKTLIGNEINYNIFIESTLHIVKWMLHHPDVPAEYIVEDTASLIGAIFFETIR